MSDIEMQEMIQDSSPNQEMEATAENPPEVQLEELTFRFPGHDTEVEAVEPDEEHHVIVIRDIDSSPNQEMEASAENPPEAQLEEIEFQFPEDDPEFEAAEPDEGCHCHAIDIRDIVCSPCNYFFFIAIGLFLAGIVGFFLAIFYS